MPFQPIGDRVLVQRILADDKTPGGVFIPDTAKEKPQRGVVLAVGDGRVAEDGHVVAMPVKPGDSILFGKYNGVEVTLDDQELLIMRDSDIMGIFR